MEEQLTPLLLEIIEKKQDDQIKINILEKYYKLFDNKKYLGNSFEEIYNDIKNVYNIDLQSLRYGYNNKNEQIIYRNLILSVINETYVKKKIKLIPLIIYLDSSRIFYDYLYEIGYFNDFVFNIKDFFTNTIQHSGIKVNNLENLSSYDYEREWFEKYKKGIDNLNFKQIYSFVEDVERGFGYRFDKYLDFLVFIVYKYFLDDLVEIINNKKDMFEIIYSIHILNTEEMLRLALQSNNYLVKFEAIRKAVYFKFNNTLCLNLLKSERSLLTSIIIQLSYDNQIWQQFLNYFLEYPLRSIQLFTPMAGAILELDNDKIDFLIDIIKIDNYLDDDSQNALNSMFFNIKDKDKQKYISEKIYNRWLNYIENYQDDFSSIILTDVIGIVIYYIQEYLDKDTIVSQLKKSILNIQEINNKWFKDIIEHNNYFYKQLSKIFVYSFTIDKYKLEEFKLQIQNICNKSYLLKKEEGYRNGKTTLKLFNEYILGVNDE